MSSTFVSLVPNMLVEFPQQFSKLGKRMEGTPRIIQHGTTSSPCSQRRNRWIGVTGSALYETTGKTPPTGVRMHLHYPLAQISCLPKLFDVCYFMRSIHIGVSLKRCYNCKDVLPPAVHLTKPSTIIRLTYNIIDS